MLTPLMFFPAVFIVAAVVMLLFSWLSGKRKHP